MLETQGRFFDFEETGVAHQIEFDTVEITFPARLLDVLEFEFARLLVDPVVHPLVAVTVMGSQPIVRSTHPEAGREANHLPVTRPFPETRRIFGIQYNHS